MGTPIKAPVAKKRAASVKQRKYVAGRLAGKSKRRAALDAGYAPSAAKNAKAKIDPKVEGLFRELLAKEGITDELIAQRITEGLSATWVKFHGKRSTELPDFEERRHMVELVCRLEGRLNPKLQLTGKNDGPIIFKWQD